MGDLTAPPQIELVHLDELNTIVDTQAMAIVPLIAPPQGGWIVLLGVRATNLDGCGLTLTTALVDGCNGQIIKVDSRPSGLDPDPDRSGWGVTTANGFGNLPVCPQLTATRDLYDVPYEVRVAIEDRDGRTAQGSITIVPTCPAGDTRCDCECDRDFIVGNACPTPAMHATCP
ncbi:MAG: hypothetical protein ABI867_22915 [Kofleriaceae bacterium]